MGPHRNAHVGRSYVALRRRKRRWGGSSHHARLAHQVEWEDAKRFRLRRSDQRLQQDLRWERAGSNPRTCPAATRYRRDARHGQSMDRRRLRSVPPWHLHASYSSAGCGCGACSQMARVMRWCILFAAAVTACRPAPSPGPGVTPAAVYGELIEGGCLAPSDDGVKSVSDEHALHSFSWMECLFDGGTIGSCAVPCK